MIKVEDLTHIYMMETPFETIAIQNITLEIKKGEIVSIVGPTGCGKSTLVQHFNGLLHPTRGRVILDDIEISSRKISRKALCRKVGLVFQYPEHQLFEETAYEDVAFGPRNLGFSDEEVRKSVQESLEFMELPFETIKNRSPFSLSGGEMRRLALAGVLAMRPQVLILDEPTAGLDPMSRKRLAEKIRSLRSIYQTTIVLVSHDIEEITEVSDRIIVMKEGTIYKQGSIREIFALPDELRLANLVLPQYAELLNRLRALDDGVRADIFTLDEACAEVLRFVGKG